MLTLSPEQKRAFREAVMQASARADVRESINAIYRDLADEIAVENPRCSASGACCRFEQYGHRMFVTTMEMAVFVEDFSQRAPPEPAGRLPVIRLMPEPGACPFQCLGLCGVHPIRPFGCRVFFCDPDSTQWQHSAYERYHARLRDLHDLAGVPYLYVEWREALSAVGLMNRR